MAPEAGCAVIRCAAPTRVSTSATIGIRLRLFTIEFLILAGCRSDFLPETRGSARLPGGQPGQRRAKRKGCRRIHLHSPVRRRSAAFPENSDKYIRTPPTTQCPCPPRGCRSAAATVPAKGRAASRKAQGRWRRCLDRAEMDDLPPWGFPGKQNCLARRCRFRPHLPSRVTPTGYRSSSHICRSGSGSGGWDQPQAWPHTKVWHGIYARTHSRGPFAC